VSRIVLIHWHEIEAEDRAALLRRVGHEVTCFSNGGSPAMRALCELPADAFLIDLRRLPAQGSAMAVWLRQQKATRRVPIVFIEGDPEKTGRVREQLPDAAFTPWSKIRGCLRRAIARPPRRPVVPGTMDAYAGAPLTKKLGIRPGVTVMLLDAPQGFEKVLGSLPPEVHLRRQARGRAGVILLFATSVSRLERRFPVAARALADAGRLWLAWPKKTSGVRSDLTQTVVRRFGLDAGFVDYKISAIDSTWSALCFARRRSS